MATSIAALESGIIGPEDEIVTKGKFTKYGDLVLKCLIYTNVGATHGKINISEALMYSCNYFYYTIGDKMKIADLDRVAKNLGLGEPTGVELPESTGYRANPETKKAIYTGTDRVWVQGDLLTAVIGQSDNRFTPLQLCVYTATVASRGTRYKATFMNRVVSTDYQELLAENTPKVVSQLKAKDSTWDAIHEGMRLVNFSRGGTAYSGAWRTMPVKVAGKTSTAEQVWGASANGAYVCFAPLKDPEIAVVVYVEKAGHGNTLAAVARAVINEYYNVGTVSDVDTYENKLS